MIIHPTWGSNFGILWDGHSDGCTRWWLGGLSDRSCSHIVSCTIWDGHEEAKYSGWCFHSLNHRFSKIGFQHFSTFSTQHMVWLSYFRGWWWVKGGSTVWWIILAQVYFALRHADEEFLVELRTRTWIWFLGKVPGCGHCMVHMCIEFDKKQLLQSTEFGNVWDLCILCQ